jgi:hypothetical protein
MNLEIIVALLEFRPEYANFGPSPGLWLRGIAFQRLFRFDISQLAVCDSRVVKKSGDSTGQIRNGMVSPNCSWREILLLARNIALGAKY